MYIKLTEEQRGILNVQQMDFSSPLFNYGICICLGEKKATSCLKSFCESVYRKIPLLRGRISKNELVIDENELSQEKYSVVEVTDIESYISADLKEVFNIEKHLSHLTMMVSKNNMLYVYVKVHHLIFDGYSIPILEKTLNDIWNEKYVEEIPLGITIIPYKVKCREYWQQKMVAVEEETFDTALIGASDLKKTSHIEGFISSNKVIQLHTKLPENISIKQYYVAALEVLNRLYGNHIFKMGMPLNNRTKENSKSIGCFMSVLPLIFSSKTEKVDELFNEIREEIYHIFRNRFIPLEEIKKLSDEKNQLYNITMSIISENGWAMGNSTKIYSPMEQQEDLTILIYDKENGDVVIRFSYKEASFEKSVIEKMLCHYIKIIECLAECDNIKKIDYMSKEEIAEMQLRNHTDKIREFKDVCSKFRDSANKYPNEIAVEFMDETITYRELHILSNKLASYIKKKATEKVVGIYMNRSIELIVSVLGVLKAGYSYLPIDPTYPKERVEYILEDSKVGMLLVCGSDNLNVSDLHIPFLDMEEKKYKNYNEIISYDIMPDTPAYIIYTSGSTGNPKGVVNIHKGLSNRLEWMIEEIGYTKETVFLQKTPYSFDVSVWELILPFTIGAKLVVAKPEGHKDVNYLIDTITQSGVTTIHFVPSMFEIFLENKRISECKGLGSIICSGEGLNNFVAGKSLEVLPETSLYNLYGPTEASIDVTAYKVLEKPKNSITSIGKPIDNIKIYIVNDKFELVPDGVKGQLLISGIGLAEGYYNREELTKQKFIKNPFSDELNFERVYCSGDYAKFGSDGNIIFMGRMDNQVKLNGQRVELGEIEQAIKNMGLLSEIKVLIRKVGKINSLIAFYTAEREIDIDDVKRKISSYLPTYMVPNLYVKLTEFPLTPNGKLDIRYLSQLPLEMKKRNVVLPQTQEQKELLEVFKKILKNDEIGINDDFFEYGGDSLGAIQIVSEMPHIDLNKIYKYRTVKDIVSAVAMPIEESILKLLSDDCCDKGLICFPYGGGNPYAYADMAYCLPEGWCMYGVDLPGHHYGDSHDKLLPIECITKLVIREIKKLGLKKIYLYGHCTGAAIAYDVCKKMEEAGTPVNLLCVGATYPFVNGMNSDYQMNKEEMYNFIKEIGGFKSDKISKMQVDEMLDWFRFDVEQTKKYFENKENRKVLLTPIKCITSKKDKFTIGMESAVANWKKLSVKVFFWILEQGEHYFITEVPKDVVDCVFYREAE
ncbi:MAG: amino acid adenylation domain-containing protein [Alphaproteobacteria bacterium]|nr:amino acid adenylation domain-containing protein [Alphaproteobacteria bacterium]